MAEAARDKQAVLEAPVVAGQEVLTIARDEVNQKDGITDLVKTIVTADPAATGAFHVLDLGKVAELFAAWRRGLEGVRPYYSVKCNQNAALLGALAGLGVGFDCASRGEMEAVLALGVAADRILYANPCKLESHVEYAASVGINITTFDSEDEVYKIKRCHPKCRLLLRLKAPDDGDAKFDLGTKYGAHQEEVMSLLSAARSAGMAVVGVSFHVGTAVSRVGVYGSAIEAARVAFDAAAALGMPPMRVLNIGGGFRSGGSTFGEAAKVINTALALHFGDVQGVEVIAEPGRYFAEKTFTLAARIFGKRTRGEVREYWIDDGMFGTLCCVHFENYVPRPVPVSSRPVDGEADPEGKMYLSTVFGPTLDSFDEVVRGAVCRSWARVGDWLVFHDVGAYSTACSSNFNGFSTSRMRTYLAYTT